jgi:hypothetical protein
MSAQYANHMGRESMYLLQAFSKPVPNMFKTKTSTTLKGIRAGHC